MFPTANRQPPTANRQPPTANSQPPTANRQQPTANRQKPKAKNSLQLCGDLTSLLKTKNSVLNQHNMYSKIQNKKILVTGGAGFIGSNLCEDLLKHNNEVVCLDNFSTGHKHNILDFLSNPNFRLIDGDIRDLITCKRACEGVEFVLHQAALGSVPRSINDPVSTNEVNITGFLNMLVAARDAGVKRFVYAASSSTYGDSENLPKVEEIIGKPLSPYAVTKYVNELYAHVFALNYNMEVIGLRYFNVYGRRQDPNGAYAAVIPKFADQFIRYESPVINGDGSNSRDFTYIDNVIQMNHLAATTTNQEALGQVFNTAVGDRTTLLQLSEILKKQLKSFFKESNIVKKQNNCETNYQKNH